MPREELEGWSVKTQGGNAKKTLKTGSRQSGIKEAKVYEKSLKLYFYLKFGADAHSRARQARSTAA